jgi:Golgi apparatus protein 1
MRTPLVSFALTCAVLAAGIQAARALDPPCVADAKRLCPGIPAGDGRLWECLVRNEFQLSSACQQNIREIQGRAAEFSADCAADVYRFCPRTPAGGGRVLQCLRAHAGRRELASNCEDAVVRALENLGDFAEACGGDAAALCAGVQPGGGKLFACLRAQSGRLSSRCRSAVNL